MKQTPNYNLPILEAGDKYLKDYQNDAFSVIDTELKAMNNKINTLDNVEGSILETNQGLKNTNAEIVDARVGQTTLGDKIRNIDTQLDTIAIIVPKTNDINILQLFFDNLPNNINLKFPNYEYLLTDVIVIENKHNIAINATDASFSSLKHGYGCIEIKGCTNIRWTGGTIVGRGSYPSNTFDGTTLKNEKEDYKAVWGFRRNGDSKTTPVYNDGYLGNCGIGLLIHQGCKNVLIEKIDVSNFNFSGICVGFRGNGDNGWGDINNVVESEKITIRECNCHDNFSSGILLCQVDGFEISSNRLLNNGHPNATINDYEVDPGYGITCTGTWYHAKNGFIKNNICINNKRKGIDAHAGENIEISDNIIDNSFIQGIAVVTNNKEVERLFDFKINSNTVLNCANAKTGKNINKAIIVQGDNITKITNNIIKNSANKEGSYAIETVGGTKIIDGNIIENSGFRASIRNYGAIAITTNNTIISPYDTAIMTGDSIFNKVEGNSLNSSYYTTSPTILYINGVEGGVISNNTSNIKSIISFGANESNVQIYNNNNVTVADNIKGKKAIVRPEVHTFKIFVDNEGNVTYNDYGRNLVQSVISHNNGVKIDFTKHIKNVSVNIISGDSQFSNKIKNVYLREVHDNAIIIGLDSSVTGYGKPIENFTSTNLIVTIISYF